MLDVGQVGYIGVDLRKELSAQTVAEILDDFSTQNRRQQIHDQSHTRRFRPSSRRSSKAGRPSTPIITNRRPARSTRLRSTLPQVRTMRSRSFAHTPTRDARRCTSIG
jgi:hypothetical protein